jgi:hypothetical protein
MGMEDPIPNRLIVLPGEDRVAPPKPAELAPALRPRGWPQAASANALRAAPTDRLAGLLRAVQGAGEGQRHFVLYWSACRVGEMVVRGEADASASVAALVGAAMDGGGRDARRAEATARDGILRGIAEAGR